MAEAIVETTPKTTPEVTPNELPHLKVIERVKELPIIEMALNISAETYFKVKDSNILVNWALSTAETSLNNAKKQAMPIAVPIAKKLESPIGFVDDTLCFGLDKIEEKVPLVKEQPAQILEKAVSRISYVNDLIIAQATNLRDLSWSTANHLLGTSYGSVAIKGVEGTAVIVDKLIDKYFPPIGKEEKKIEIKTDEEDKLLHTLQTVGLLSNKAARRVYGHVIHQLNTLKESSLTAYVNSLVEFLRLTKYLHSITEKTEEKEKIHINDEKKEELQKKKENKEVEDTKKEDIKKEDTKKEDTKEEDISKENVEKEKSE